MILGIDLGTTNSLGCIVKDGSPILIPNSYGEYLTPSVVGLDDQGEIIVGKLAKERLMTHPHLTQSNFKRYMGTSQKLQLGNQFFSAEELSSFVIRKIVEDAICYLGEAINELVISVPAYFSDAGRGATQNAGKLAGYFVERIINEPSAAALAYHIHEEEDQTYAVIDLGGGTLDVSIVDAFDNVIEILAVAGDNHLGGEDFTQMIIQECLFQWKLDWNQLSMEEKAKLHLECDKAKIALDLINEVMIMISIGGQNYQYSLTYERFFELSKGLLSRVEQVIQRAFGDAKDKMYALDGVILVGGSSKLRVYQEFIEYLFDDREVMTTNPDTAIGIGCGLVAGIKERQEEIKDLLLTDICPFSLGIEITGGVFSPIIERNSPLPFSREKEFETSELGQKEVNIRVYQGENYLVKDNILLGSLCIKVPKNFKEKESFNIRFTYDINGILEIDTKILSTGESYGMRILSKTHSMTEEEIQKKIQELQKLKLHPRKDEKNEFLLAKAYRIYAQVLGSKREILAMCIKSFEEALDQQERRRIQQAYDRLEDIIGDR